jgi:hypothetical protein
MPKPKSMATRHTTRRQQARQRLVLAGVALAVIGVIGVVLLWRSKKRTPPLKGPFPARALHSRPLRFDPHQVPRQVRLLRTSRPFRPARCVAAYRKRCIQQLPLETYVHGVVAGEEAIFQRRAPHRPARGQRRLRRIQQAWQLQAVAARTYVVYTLLARKYNVDRVGFHITDSAWDQVYQDGRHPLIEAAVRETAGLVLVNRRQRLIYAEYSASCGGQGTWDVVRRTQRIPCHPRCQHYAFRGSTHRRGMCQWGSLLFALEGRPLRWLVRRYYPNARLYRLPAE